MTRPMTLHNPTELKYDELEPGNGPKFGVTTDPSTDFMTAARSVRAWFVDAQDAGSFAYRVSGFVWDLETGQRR